MTSKLLDKITHFPVATIGIYGEDLDPDFITSALRQKPSSCHKAGDEFTSKSGQIRTAKTGAWIFHSDDLVAGPNLNDHIEAVLSLLTDLPRPLLSMDGIQSASLTLALTCQEQPQVGVMSIPQLQLLFNRGVDLKLEVYSDD